jgi:hypothetical protein
MHNVFDILKHQKQGQDMKKILLASMLLFSTSLFAEVAKETKFFPIMSGDYCAAPTVALMGGATNYDDMSGSADSYGVELRFGCPVFQIKGYDIRQVLSIVHDNGNGFKTTSLEMNPRIMFPLSKDVEFGFGPGLGVIFAKDDIAGKDTVWGVNVGVSLHYDVTNKIFIGVESRYQWTQDTDFGGDIDNFRTMVKIGTRF